MSKISLPRRLFIGYALSFFVLTTLLWTGMLATAHASGIIRGGGRGTFQI